MLRVYDRQASLQSTAEAIAGIEHVLSWRPSGNLIATTQRFGFEGGGAGKEGRHDVVFFEKNGLRHGEFGLGEGLFKRRDDGTWGYKVRELSWSSDSTVLALWIQRDGEDVGTFSHSICDELRAHFCEKYNCGQRPIITGTSSTSTPPLLPADLRPFAGIPSAPCI